MAHNLLYILHLGPGQGQQAVFHSEVMLGDDEKLTFTPDETNKR